MSAVTELQEAIAGAAEGVGPSVVGLGRGWGRGSGVVIATGQVLTSAHNLRGDEVGVTFADGRVEDGRVTAADPDLDLAVIEVDTGDAPVVEWPEDGPEPAIGSPVVALANPGGRGLRATLGFVSSSGRSFRGPRGRRVAGALEHTAALPRGSSGGPLVDAEGRLLGINSLRLEGGLILAVPTTGSARERILRLGRGESPRTRKLGVAVAPPRIARRMLRAVGLPERSGLLVRRVEDGSAADGAGIQQGDLIVAARGRELDGLEGLYSSLESVPEEGGELDLTVLRGGEEREVTVSFSGLKEAA